MLPDKFFVFHTNSQPGAYDARNALRAGPTPFSVSVLQAIEHGMSHFVLIDAPLAARDEIVARLASNFGKDAVDVALLWWDGRQWCGHHQALMPKSEAA